MTSKTETVAKPDRDEEELAKVHQKLQQATADAIAVARSLSREIKLQKAAAEKLRAGLEDSQCAASESLADTSQLISAVNNPSELWSVVARDVAQLGDGTAHDELVRALQESSSICESFIGEGGDEELVRRIDAVIAMLEGD